MHWGSLAFACLWENIGVEQDKIHHYTEVNAPCEIPELGAGRLLRCIYPCQHEPECCHAFFFLNPMVSSCWKLLYAFGNYKSFFINLEIENFSSAGLFSLKANCFFQLWYLTYSLNIRLLLFVLRFSYGS